MGSRMRFEFATANRIIFGPGTIAQAGTAAREFGRKALVVTGRDSSRAKRLFDSLRGQEIEFVPFPIDREPDVDVIRLGLKLARSERCDMVIAMGGGSALDSGKAIAALLTNDGDIVDYLEVVGHGKLLTHPSAPFVAIPTTSGTGSEVTRNAVLALPDRRIKVSLRSPFMLARIALVDPELTWDLPPDVTARTGLDALTQLIEPYVTPRANAMTDCLCLEGIKRAARSLPTAVKHGTDAAAREDMAVASLFGGLALANAGLGAVHGLAGVIGGKFGAPHGAICGILLPRVMSANLAALRSRQPSHPSIARFREIAQLLTGENTAQAEDGVAWVQALLSDLKTPALGTYGLSEGNLRDTIEQSRNASSMKANPILLTDEELTFVVRNAL